MRKTLISCFVLATTGAQLVAGVAQSQSSVAPLRGDAERGKADYESFGCYSCHGHTGETGAGARLNPPRLERAAFIAYVRNPPPISGGPFRMPAYGGEAVTDQVLADIFAYLQSLDSGTPPLEDIALLNGL
jgi:mono/diheme cytochrome c family protein